MTEPPEQEKTASGNPAEERVRITFQAAAKAAKWFENRRQSAERPPPILHHFTDANGLFGILDTHTLRASLAMTLNDCSEVEYGVNLAQEVLSQLRTGPQDPFLDCAVANLALPGALPSTNMSLIFVPFVVSLCPDIQRSAHWLHYGRAGRGAAIGFDSGTLATLKCALLKVEYRRSVQEESIRSLFTHARAVFAETQPRIHISVASKFFGLVFSMLMSTLSVEFKAESFSGEEEWRLVSREVLTTGVAESAQAPSAETRFRPADGRIVAYQDISFPAEAIKKIVLGHSSSMSTDDISLDLLKRRAAPTAEIVRSIVPVR